MQIIFTGTKGEDQSYYVTIFNYFSRNTPSIWFGVHLIGGPNPALRRAPHPIIRMIFPGFMMFFGSSACLIARIVASSTGEE